jgi:hypothetical protein
MDFIEITIKVIYYCAIIFGVFIAAYLGLLVLHAYKMKYDPLYPARYNFERKNYREKGLKGTVEDQFYRRGK